MRFEGGVALINGGTAGIGQTTARRIASRGARVAFAGRNENDGRRIERELLRDGAEVAFIKAGLSRPNEVRRIVPATEESLDVSTTRSTTTEFPTGTD